MSTCCSFKLCLMTAEIGFAVSNGGMDGEFKTYVVRYRPASQHPICVPHAWNYRTEELHQTSSHPLAQGAILPMSNDGKGEKSSWAEAFPMFVDPKWNSFEHEAMVDILNKVIKEGRMTLG